MGRRELRRVEMSIPNRLHRDGKHLSHHVRHAPSLSWVPGEETSCQKLEFLKQFHIKSDMYGCEPPAKSPTIFPCDAFVISMTCACCAVTFWTHTEHAASNRCRHQCVLRQGRSVC